MINWTITLKDCSNLLGGVGHSFEWVTYVWKEQFNVYTKFVYDKEQSSVSQALNKL